MSTGITSNDYNMNEFYSEFSPTDTWTSPSGETTYNTTSETTPSSGKVASATKSAPEKTMISKKTIQETNKYPSNYETIEKRSRENSNTHTKQSSEKESSPSKTKQSSSTSTLSIKSNSNRETLSNFASFHVSLGVFSIFLGLVATTVYLAASNYDFFSLATGIWSGTMFIFVGGIAKFLNKKRRIC